ncbi:hypothetical protein ACJJTC_007996 [Scirpophaga incertulas]
MPRTKATKRSVREQDKAVEDDMLKNFDKFAADQKHQVDIKIQMEIRNIELAFDMLLGSISNSYLQKTLGELKSELYLIEESATQKGHSSRATSHDDVLSSSSRSTRRSRSADTRRVNKPPPTIQTTRSRSVYRTPAYNKNAANNYPAITPKVTPQTPLTVLRQPRQGEMVVSMSGSPVMVPSCYTMQPEEKANCNILLRDGTMLSLQPKQLRQSQAYIPFSLMDDNVLLQLKTLKENLEKVVKLGEKQMK